uniref:hypothetical protein n=1 Tax=Segatella hominis TaxID=2518605 RepID=UPI0021C745AA
MIQTIDQQIELERSMVTQGREAYLRTVNRAFENGRAHETASAGRLMREAIRPVADALSAWLEIKTPGNSGKIKPLLKLVNPDNAAFITLQVLFNSFTSVEYPLATVGQRIGRRIEDELR